MSIEIRLMKRHEGPLANQFFNSIYKSTRSQGDFDWEFINGPSGPAIYVIAIDSSVTSEIKIVGIQCAIPIKLSDSAGNSVLTAKSEDTLVDPAYRGKKIFENMYDLLFRECTNSGIKYIWGFTPAKKAFERIGFNIPFQAHQALMVFKPKDAFSYLVALNTANKLADKLKIAALSFLAFVSSSKHKSTSVNNLVSKEVVFESKQETISKLAQNAPYHFLDMSASYLNWRVKLNPFGNGYQNYHFFQDDKLIADVIINIRNKLGYIEQIIFHEGLDRGTRLQVISKTIAMMKGRVSLIRLLCFDVNEELARQEVDLRASGFVVLARGAHFVWKSLGGDELDARNLFLSRLFTQGNQ